LRSVLAAFNIFVFEAALAALAATLFALWAIFRYSLFLFESQRGVGFADLANETLYTGLLSFYRLTLLIRHMGGLETGADRTQSVGASAKCADDRRRSPASNGGHGQTRPP
jgi:hypothetical protein